ncbi:MAG: cyclic nucleotide-binding domain-containing protein [Ghiorsea sp.]
MTEEITKKELEQALDTYTDLVEMYPDNEAYLQRYADMLQTLGRDATATITLQHLHDIIAARSSNEASAFAKKYPQIGRIKLEDSNFEYKDKHAVAGQIIRDLLSKLWLCMHRKKLKDGAALYRIGEAGDSLSLVLDGSIDVYTVGAKDTRILLEKVNANDVVGEQMFVNPGKRVIDAFASGDCTIIHIPRKRLTQMVLDNPYLGKLLSLRATFRTQTRIITTNVAFQTLPLKLRLHIGRNLILNKYKADNMIHHLKQPIQGIDVILAGEACYLATLKSGKKIMLPPLNVGSLTGDVMLQGGKSTDIAELYAKSDVTIAHLTYEDMLNVSIAFPPLQERLQKHAETQRLRLMQAFEKIQ